MTDTFSYPNTDRRHSFRARRYIISCSGGCFSYLHGGFSDCDHSRIVGFESAVCLISHRAMEIDERWVYLVLVSIDTGFFNSNLPEFGDWSRKLTITTGVGTRVDRPDRRKSGSQHRVTYGNRKLCGSTRGRN